MKNNVSVRIVTSQAHDSRLRGKSEGLLDAFFDRGDTAFVVGEDVLEKLFVLAVVRFDVIKSPIDRVETPIDGFKTCSNAFGQPSYLFLHAFKQHAHLTPECFYAIWLCPVSLRHADDVIIVDA